MAGANRIRSSRRCVFVRTRLPRRAKAGQRVTQMHYARKGIVTPEMEYIAIRENQRFELVAEALKRQHPGDGCAPAEGNHARVRADAALACCAIIPANINHPEIEPIIGRNFLVKDQCEHRTLRQPVRSRKRSRRWCGPSAGARTM